MQRWLAASRDGHETVRRVIGARLHWGALTLAAVVTVTASAAGQTNVPPRPLQDQLDGDITPLPAGMGALFVPSLTSPSAEPMVVVFYDGERVAAARTSERIVLPPGEYEVAVGSGPFETRAKARVHIKPGLTTPVEPFYGAVRVRTVTPNGMPTLERYVIVDQGSRSVLRSADALAEPATWLLPPGRYLVALGSRSEGKRNTLPIVVTAGEVVFYELTVDEGRLVRIAFADEFAEVRPPGPWRLSWVLGGSGSLVQRRHQLSGLDGQAALLEASTEFEGGIDTGGHLALLSLNLDQSFIGLDSTYGASVPLRPLRNEAEAELLYNYRPGRFAGPYVRVLGRTSIMTDRYFASGATTATTLDEAGVVVATEAVAETGTLRLFDPLRPLTLQEGAGVAVTLVDNAVASLQLRGGVAARQAYYEDGRVITNEEVGELDLLQLDDNERWGGEATALGSLRASDSLVLRTRFDSFVPHRQLLDGEQLRPIFRWDNSAVLRLSQIIYVGYSFRLSRDELALEELQTEQSAALRVQFSVF